MCDQLTGQKKNGFNYRVRYFALQEWIHVDKDIILIHIPTILNSADALTKALAWTKHHRHMSRAMGHLGSPFSS
jgi:hypothetical protein